VAGAIRVFGEEFDHFIEHGHSLVASRLMDEYNPDWIARSSKAKA
jgi:hypothetical protein